MQRTMTPLRFLLLAVLLSTAVPARADLLVGVAGPMSGAFAPIGGEIEAGVRAAVAAVNARGGVLGEALAVETVDDKCDPQVGAAVANQLVGKGAVLVVGHACTAAALPAARVYAENGMVVVSPAATNPRFTDERVGPAVFRMAPRNDGQPRAIAAHLLAAFGGGRVAFVHDGGAYGQGLAEAARQAFEAGGGTAVLTEGFTPGEQSQNALVGKLQDAGADAVVIGALQADAAVVAAEMRERGLDAAIIGGEALGLEEFRDLAGPAAEGVTFAVPRDWSAEPQAQAAVAALAAVSATPHGATLPAYAAVQAWARAAQAAGTVDGPAVAERMTADQVDTVIGPVSFDDKGDLTGAGWRMMRWQDGRPVPVE